MTWRPDEPDDCTIARFDGTPNEPLKPGEADRWQRFLRLIWPWAKKGGKWAAAGAQVAKEYARAEALGKKHAATKIAAEAAEAAAKADQARQKTVLDFGEVVDTIFRNDGQPQAAKMLKLAKLVEQNPKLLKQTEKIAEIIERLSLTRGTVVEIRPDLPLPPGAADTAIEQANAPTEGAGEPS